MSFFEMLGAFLIGPLKLIFEVIYKLAYDLVLSPGAAIIFLSLAMNVLVLPLYRRADAMQEHARDVEAALKPGVTHIKKTFSGNERMMMLQTYYRQNGYSPVNALKGSVSLLLEIPFFMAAYQYLSGLELLRGVPFGPIADLAAPDGLIKIGALSLNLLPILMTVINFISAAIYLKGYPLKTKIQLYGMAVFFLFFLYSSPSGLVFYWTLNNVFSLVKNVFYKLKNSGAVIAVLCAVLGAGSVTLYFIGPSVGMPQLKRAVMIVLGVALFIPAVLRLVKRKARPKKERKAPSPKKLSFILAAVFLTLFIGVLIPSAFVAGEPQEFIDPGHFVHPIWFVVNSALLAGGTFILWFGVFYWLASPRGKVIFERAMWTFCGVAAVDYMFFGKSLGIISASLKYENGLFFGTAETVVNILVVLAVVTLFVFISIRFGRAVPAVLLAASVSVGVMAGINVAAIGRGAANVEVADNPGKPDFTLSRNGKNVVVIMLDRAIGAAFPYLAAEKPELKEIYDGFTYYSNVISYGGHTNMAAPAMMGGYEYTPVELNKRDGEPLAAKHDESLMVMPVNFLNAGYEVTVCDPPYAGYQWIPDLSIYDPYPGIRKFITKGKFSSDETAESTLSAAKRNFFPFAVMKSIPLLAEPLVYDSGNYHAAVSSAESAGSTAAQTRTGISTAVGENQSFLDPWGVLVNLGKMTEYRDDGNTFLFLCNDTTHEPMMLKEPEYVPADKIDNTEFDDTHRGRFVLDGRIFRVNSDREMIHYQTNMAALIQIGKWLDGLKAQGVYDNTRIIITSDHGYFLNNVDELLYPYHGEYDGDLDVGSFFPLLLVKDFGDHGFTESDEFMTSADVPVIAFSGIIENPTNPATGKPINDAEKYAHDQFIMTYHSQWDTKTNNGNEFLPTRWAAITNDIWDRSDWEFIDDEVVLKDHKIPD